jgi:hypothetical protein
MTLVARCCSFGISLVLSPLEAKPTWPKRVGNVLLASPRPQSAIVSLRSWAWLLAIDSSRQRRKQLQNATGELIWCGQARSSEYGEDRQPLDHRHRLGGVPPGSFWHCHASFPSTSSHLNYSSKPLPETLGLTLTGDRLRTLRTKQTRFFSDSASLAPSIKTASGSYTLR